MEIQEIALSKALVLLRAAGAQYIIKVGDAVHVHGDLKLAAPESERKRKQRVPMNTYKNVYEPILRDLKPEQFATIPWSGLSHRDMQAACSAWCTKYWGKKTYLTHKTEEGLQVLRMA